MLCSKQVDEAKLLLEAEKLVENFWTKFESCMGKKLSHLLLVFITILEIHKQNCTYPLEFPHGNI